MRVRRLVETVERSLWPLVEGLMRARPAAGLAVAVVQDDEVVTRGFGVRDVRTGAPVTSTTMFHLASVSKPFVAAAAVSLVVDGELDLDAPVTSWVPELVLTDGRQDEVTARGLLSHTSGLPDVSEYGWHDPLFGDDALSEFVAGLSGWRLQSDPGVAHAYSNAGYEVLGLVVARALGTTFEEAMRGLVLGPFGMPSSTFLRTDVPAGAASPHVGRPLVMPGESYPYTRSHAPSSTLHSNLDELSQWLLRHLEPAERTAGLQRLMWGPAVDVGNPPWEEAWGLGWAIGRHGDDRVLSHGGLDPGFMARIALVPGRHTGVAVLANSNTLPVSSLANAALDVLLGEPASGAVVREPAAPPPQDVDEAFEDAVWGAIELHRADLVWPVLQEWAESRPDSAGAWAMTAWAHEVDGDLVAARAAAGRALDLDPGHEEAAAVLRRLP